MKKNTGPIKIKLSMAEELIKEKDDSFQYVAKILREALKNSSCHIDESNYQSKIEYLRETIALAVYLTEKEYSLYEEEY